MIHTHALFTDGAYRPHVGFWTAAFRKLDANFLLRQPWLSMAVEEGATCTAVLRPSDATSRLVDKIGQGDDLGIFAVVTSAVALVLRAHAGTEVVIIDTPPLGHAGDDADAAIPVVVRMDGSEPLRDHLTRIGTTLSDGYSYQDFPVARMCEALLAQPRRLSNVLMSVPGVHGTPPASAPYDLHIEVSRRTGLEITLHGRAPACSGAFVQLLIRRLDLALQAHANLGALVRDLDLMGPDERQRLLVAYNDTARDLGPDLPIHEAFAACAREHGEGEAVRLHDDTVSYDTLNRQANRLARFLRREYGVSPGDVIGVATHRSPSSMAGLLGVLKAGAVYLPIDPDYPEERLRFMVEDAGVKVLLVHAEHFERLMPLYETPMFALDLQLATLEDDDADFDSGVVSTDPAYVIYTSGSTGQPKAVLLEHRGFVNMVRHHVAELGVGAGDRLLQFYGHSFDSSLFEIFVALLSGATLVMVDRETIGDPEQLSALIEARQITMLTLPPIYSSTLDRARLGSVRLFVSAGDNCRVEDAAYFAGRAGYYNSYGPTETSVCVTHHKVEPSAQYGARIPIGRAISNAALYVLDDRLALVPDGIAGEIAVGGISLARGYLNQDALTGEKFVPSPFVPGERLYRTGDVGVRLPDGTLELLGRKDNQVKIRGYRVELGEIESVLAQHPEVGEAVVLAQEDAQGRRLVAYVRGTGTVDTSALRELVRARLPEFMMPSAIHVIDRMPITANGKVDRRALPDMIAAEAPTAAMELPANETQATLADAWREALGIEQVGIRDNFFELGGDSILAIQVVSRARAAGLRLTPTQVFEHQTIAELAEVAVHAGGVADENHVLDGPAPLGPMQTWFFEQDFTDASHFNQSVLLEVPAGSDAGALAAATLAVIAHHDALRLRFVQHDGQWSAEYTAPGDAVPFEAIDLSDTPRSEQTARLREHAARVQAGLDLSAPPLVRVALFDLGPDQSARLLVIAHHLVVDGVSWRILLEDLQTAYAQARNGEPVGLPVKTTSYRTWVTRLRALAPDLRSEHAFWTAPSRATTASLPVDLSDHGALPAVASAREVTRVLDEETTAALLHEAPRAYTTEINDLLLTALVGAFTDWTGRSELLVDLEGHGREDLFDDVDTSRTVGWFTSQFPVLLTAPAAGGPGETLKAIKEQLRAVPRRGLGFGVLRYLAGDAHLAAGLNALPRPDVLFNYLGQAGRALVSGAGWTPVPGAAGSDVSPRAARTHALEVTGLVLDGRLSLTWTFSDVVHRRDTIEALARHYDARLRDLVDHCRTATTQQFTPSDFPAARLDQQSLDALVARLKD